MIILIPIGLIAGWFLLTYNRKVEVEETPSYPMYYIVPVQQAAESTEPTEQSSWFINNFHWIAILSVGILLFI